MKTKLVLMISILLATASTLSRADEGDDDDDDQVRAEDILLEKTFPASPKLNPLHVVVHKAGHLEDRPFVVEVSELCPQSGSVQPKERDIDTISSCDVAPKTLAFNEAAGELTVLVREPTEEGTCAKKPKKVVMQLQSICAEQE